MAQWGPSPEVIVASIQRSQTSLDTSAAALEKLKAAGVPNSVILAMVEASGQPSKVAPAGMASVNLPLKDAATDTVTRGTAAIPSDPGMYLVTNGQSEIILGQAVTFERTGSRMVSTLTLHLKAAHDNVQLPGRHAQTVADANPVFIFIPSEREKENGVTAGDLVLIRLETQGDRRQIEVAAEGTGRGSSGISMTHQIAAVRSELASGRYEIKPADPLKRGEYALYLQRGEGLPAMIFDFSVEDSEH